MPAAADQGHESLEYYPRTTGRPDHIPVPMHQDNWIAVRERDGRYTIFAQEDERVVAQTNGTWSKGPNSSEAPQVVRLIAASPVMRRALVAAEKHLKSLIQADPDSGPDGMRSPHYAAYAEVSIALAEARREPTTP